MNRASVSGRRKARDPYGIGPVGSAIGPIASVVGLVLIAVVTINLFNYELPFASGDGGNGERRSTAGGPAI